MSVDFTYHEDIVNKYFGWKPSYGSTEPYFTENTENLKYFSIELNRSQDPAHHDHTPADKAKNHRFLKVSLRTLVFAFIFGLVTTIIPTPVQASVFENISSLFSSLFVGKTQEVSAETRIKVSEQATYLSAAINIDPNPAKGGGDIVVVGGVALLPETGPSGSIADISEHSTSDQISLYIVREGDTLSGIGKMFGVSANTILWANDLTRADTIHEGQSLIILPVSGVRHTVKSGDTVASITKKYKGDLKEVLAFNELSENTSLSIGSVVVVPYGVLPAPVTPSKTTKPASGGGGTLNDPSGYFIRPIAGGTRSQGLHGYNAVDIAAKEGTPILAAAAGTVVVSKNSGWNGGYGSYIVLQHKNGSQTLYAHMTSTAVSVGASVGQGEVIGYVGSTGRSTGAHLHFEVRGGFRNPFAY